MSFVTLAPLGFPDLTAPFLAEANVPSIKVSDKSSLPRLRKSSANVSNTFFSLPSLTQLWKRRWQVWYGGNLSGKSDHRAPERKIHKTPFKTSRAGRAGLPRVWILSVFSNNGFIKAHCSSVNSSRRAIREFYQTIFEMASSNISPTAERYETPVVCLTIVSRVFSSNLFQLDEYAAQTGGNLTAINLAAALVKIAIFIPARAKPAMPAGAYLVESQTATVAFRVEELIKISERGNTPSKSGRTIKFPIYAFFCLTMVLTVATNRDFLHKIHDALEVMITFQQ